MAGVEPSQNVWNPHLPLPNYAKADISLKHHIPLETVTICNSVLVKNLKYKRVRAQIQYTSAGQWPSSLVPLDSSIQLGRLLGCLLSSPSILLTRPIWETGGKIGIVNFVGTFLLCVLCC